MTYTLPFGSPLRVAISVAVPRTRDRTVSSTTASRSLAEAPVAVVVPAVVWSAPDAGAEVFLVDGAEVLVDGAEVLVDGAEVLLVDGTEVLLVDGAVVEELDAPESAPCFPLLVGVATLFWACVGFFRGFGRRAEEAFSAGRPRSASIVVTVRCAAARCSS
ncbi:hypothetical protein WME79_23105 [Sorangium sp. So ce726]|uniref:hypothetical protein n=1 Tax=Sorangium sp. So ce726 TaxID=3133319 RepID=UPI003F635B6D